MSQQTPFPQQTTSLPAKNTIYNDLSTKKPELKCNTYTDAYNISISQSRLQFFASLVGFSLFLTCLLQSKFTFNPFTLFNLFSWTTVQYSALLCFSGSIVYFLRSSMFTILEDVYPTVIARILATYTSPDTWTITGLYTLASLITVRSYFSLLLDEEYVNDIFEQPTGHYIDVRQLNQKSIFVALYAVVLAVKYSICYLEKRRHVAKITRVQQPLFYELKGNITTVLHTSVKEASCSFLITYAIFIVFSGNIYYHMAYTLGRFNRVLDSPITGFRWINLYLFTRTILAGIITTSVWNIANRLFDAIFTRTVQATQPYNNRFELILDGLANKEDTNIQASAFNELAQLACKEPENRVELFSNIGKDLRESVWYHVMTQCFRVIEELRLSIDSEYKGIQPVEAPVVPIIKPTEQKLRNRLQLADDTNIYVTPKKQLYELDDRTSTLLFQTGELVESVTPSADPIIREARNELSTRVNKIADFLKTLEMKTGYKNYFIKFYQESRVARIQEVFKKYQLIVWAVQILGSLTAASLKEDSYGYVQNDLSTVLNQLLGCFEAIEKYMQKETIVVEEVEAVKMALEEAILQIVITFNDYLNVFKIENKYQTIWGRFSHFH
ncbi:hypothetical protein CU097_012261 [Rhizopus azygosporus]|uniref:Nucleoporin NDC1 n=1 Tax=Rhizopus azygosporus TaxID=86630 RepID=A0A367K0M4_RHIAZ|nr:hypothetical protein CU097_012261 [Rhizopus azygosporus]